MGLNKEKIIEGNKLIAKFTNKANQIVSCSQQGGDGYDGCRWHESWDWLMPVCKQCSEATIRNVGHSGLYMYMNIIMIHINEFDLDGAFKSVVGFLETYYEIEDVK